MGHARRVCLRRLDAGGRKLVAEVVAATAADDQKMVGGLAVPGNEIQAVEPFQLRAVEFGEVAPVTVPAGEIREECAEVA